MERLRHLIQAINQILERLSVLKFIEANQVFQILMQNNYFTEINVSLYEGLPRELKGWAQADFLKALQQTKVLVSQD